MRRVTQQRSTTASRAGAEWWRHAVIYQVYPRSWADADGDGIGDLPGITARLDHLAELGVDALWLSPFYTSPQHDAGYDVADYRDVDPRFGTLVDADVLLARAHELGLRVVVDLVPNHSSSDHAWFRAALSASPGSPERARYVFRDGRGPDGSEPPNNWESNFGGPAWTRVTEADGSPGQWYLHLFDVTQPDFDWTNPEVGDEMESVIRFWLDRGVDGFRIDVAHGLAKADGLPDTLLTLEDLESEEHADTPTSALPMWDQPAVHEVYRRWRRVTDAYGIPGEDADRMLCAEAWVVPYESLALYVRHDELHQAFNFPFLVTPWIAQALRESITHSLEVVAPYAAPQTWVLSNHDVVRHATRLGYEPEPGPHRMDAVGPEDPQPDAALGLRRARAATALMLALPGSAYLYQGEELGLPEATQLPEEVLQDPTWLRSGHTRRGRDGCRVPVPWEHDAPSLGFGPGDRPWLPQPESYAALAVDRQRGVPGSTLELYRTLLRVRREHDLGLRELVWGESGVEEVLVLDSVRAGSATVRVVTNVGGAPYPLPEGEVLVASTDLDGDLLPADATAWIRCA